MRIRLLIFLISFFVILQSQAQQRYYVFFSDKPQQKFDPEAYFHPKALERRVKNDLPLWDEQDLPLNQEYVAKVSCTVDSVRHQLRWLNAMTVSAYDWEIEMVWQFPFVRDIQAFSGEMILANFPTANTHGFVSLKAH